MNNGREPIFLCLTVSLRQALVNAKDPMWENLLSYQFQGLLEAIVYYGAEVDFFGETIDSFLVDSHSVESTYDEIF